MTVHAGLGEGISQVQVDASARAVVSAKGLVVSFTQAEIKAGRGFSSFGEGISQAIADSRLGILGILKGESAGISMGDSFLGISIDAEPMADLNLIVKLSPMVGGGGVLTYKAGAPDIATFWDVVGISQTGFTEPPHGSLRFKYVKSDMAGNAANVYIASKNPAHVGHRDRIIVRKTSA